MSRFIIATFAACAICLTAQTTPPVAPAGEVLGVGNFIHVAANLDKSIEFYRDVIGLELTGAPGPHLFSANAVVSTLYDADGAQSRVASLKIPASEMAVEIVEFKDHAASPVQPRLQDPGAIVLRLIVRDLDVVMGRLKKAKTPVVTTGAEPVILDGSAGKTREIVVRDPDGIFVRLIQPDPAPATAAPASGNVIGAGFGVTIGNTDKNTQLYRDVLGFQPQMDTAFHADKNQMLVTGTPGAQFRRSTALVPGTSFQVEFFEFKGIDQRPAHLAIHDAGASVLRLRVRDIDGIVKALKAAGSPVVSSGGEVVSVGRSRAVIVRELDNLYLQPMQAAAP
jgi:catechol 2,3-dioxygenase-like lactoylglutathione lyase family enzyme